MAVLFDAVGPSSAGAGSAGQASPLTWSHTCTGADGLLLVEVCFGYGNHTGLTASATYNGVAMTQIGSVASNNGTSGIAFLFGLLAPATGANTVSVTFSGGTPGANSGVEAGSKSFTGVEQSSLAAAVTNFTSAFGNSANPSINVASAVGNMVSDLHINGGDAGASTQTQRWLKNINSSTAGGNGAGATAAGAASVTMGWTAALESWGMIGVNIVASGGVQNSYVIQSAWPFPMPGDPMTNAILYSRWLDYSPVSGPVATNVDVLQALETDTAQPFGKQKSKTIGQATTNEIAQQIKVQKRVTIGTAIETNTAQPIARVKSRTLAIATETDTATVMGRRKTRTLAQATETDTATVFARTKQRLVGRATETDTATRFVLPARITFGPAVETDTATALTERKQRELGQAVSDEYGGPGLLFFTDGYRGIPGFTPVKMRGIGRATETDTAQPLARRKERVVGRATETDTATVLGRRKQRVFGPALEADTATPLTETKQRILNRATETDTATALARRKERLVGRATETDTAGTTTSSGVKNIPVNRALETDTAQPMVRQKSKPIGVAVETNTAFAYSRRKQRTFGPALDSQIAQPMGRAKSKTLARATETNTAQAMARRKLRVVGTALETDSAIPILRLGGQEPEPYVRPSGDITDAGGSGDISRGRPEGILHRESSVLTYTRPSGDITRRK